jgi:hypothetical protein
MSTEKIKYTFLSLHRNVGQNCNLTANKSFESVVKFKCLGTTVTDRSCFHEEVKRSLVSGNASCHSAKNCLSASSLNT